MPLIKFATVDRYFAIKLADRMVYGASAAIIYMTAMLVLLNTGS
jgi:hypothetical protein